MGGAFTAVSDDASAADFNPAGLFQVDRAQAQVFGKLLYGGVGSGLHTMHGVVGVPVGKLGTMALRLQETGFSLESERLAEVRPRHQAGRRTCRGLRPERVQSVAGGFGQGFAFGLDLGLFARIYKMWTVGFYAHNLNMPRIGTSDLPRLLVLGLGFSPTPGIQSAVDISKEPG